MIAIAPPTAALPRLGVGRHHHFAPCPARPGPSTHGPWLSRLSLPACLQLRILAASSMGRTIAEQLRPGRSPNIIRELSRWGQWRGLPLPSADRGGGGLWAGSGGQGGAAVHAAAVLSGADVCCTGGLPLPPWPWVHAARNTPHACAPAGRAAVRHSPRERGCLPAFTRLCVRAGAW